METYNIQKIIDWLTSESANFADDFHIQRRYLDAALSLKKLNYTLERMSLRNVNVSEVSSDNVQSVAEDNSSDVIDNGPTPEPTVAEDVEADNVETAETPDVDGLAD